MENNEIKTNNQTPPVQREVASKNQVGPIIGSIVIIIIIIFGGLYFLGKKVSDEGVFAPTTEEILGETDTALQTLEIQGTSDEVSTIESDLDATILDDLDAELGNIEAELN